MGIGKDPFDFPYYVRNLTIEKIWL